MRCMCSCAAEDAPQAVQASGTVHGRPGERLSSWILRGEHIEGNDLTLERVRICVAH